MSREKPSFVVRSAPPTAAVEAFISGQRPAANLQPLAANGQTPADNAPRAARRRGIVVRADGVERARLTVYLDVEVAERLRRWAFEHGAEITEVAAEAIAARVASLT